MHKLPSRFLQKVRYNLSSKMFSLNPENESARPPGNSRQISETLRAPGAYFSENLFAYSTFSPESGSVISKDPDLAYEYKIKDHGSMVKSDSTCVFYRDFTPRSEKVLSPKDYTRNSSPSLPCCARCNEKGYTEPSFGREGLENIQLVYERKVQSAKSVLEQLNLVKERHAGIKTYLNSLKVQLSQNVNLGIAELKSKRNALVVELDTLLDEATSSLYNAQKLKEKVIRDKELEIETKLKILNNLANAIDGKIKGDTKEKFVKNYEKTLEEAEEALDMHVPECDFETDWAFIKVPCFNYAIVASAPGVKQRRSKFSRASSKDMRSEYIVSGESQYSFKKDACISPMKVHNSSNTSSTPAIEEVLKPSCLQTLNNSLFIHSPHNEGSETDRETIDKQYRQMIDQHCSRKDKMIVELMSAYKELETMYSFSASNSKSRSPNDFKPVVPRLMQISKENNPEAIRPQDSIMISRLITDSDHLTRESGSNLKLRVYIPQGYPPYSCFYSVKITEDICTSSIIERIRDTLKLPKKGKYILSIKKSREHTERLLQPTDRPGEILRSINRGTEPSWPRFYFKAIV